MRASDDERAMAAAHRALDRYQRRLDEAGARVPDRDVATSQARAEVADTLRRCLGIREEWVPEPRVSTVRERRHEGLTLTWLAATSWPGVCATAVLYRPDEPAGPGQAPLVLLACGHGQGGKLNEGYQAMARALARRGAVVLCPDNIGQGERRPMGHRDVVGPFACGLSLQGLIVMETLGWLRWARGSLDVDPRRTAAIGNSGGGLLTQMLLPFDPDLAAACSSGYPSTYGFIARKEKKHCHCNLLPGVARCLEMHHVYGCFAPRPLLLMQGEADHFFPPDLFHLTARRVRATYEAWSASDRLEAVVTPGGHSWDTGRIEIVADFLTRRLGLRATGEPPQATDDLLGPNDTCFDPWPADARSTDALASLLTGREVLPAKGLWDVFAVDIEREAAAVAMARGEVRQILAQMAAFLAER